MPSTPCVQRAPGVVGVLDPLEHDRQVGAAPAARPGRPRSATGGENTSRNVSTAARGSGERRLSPARPGVGAGHGEQRPDGGRRRPRLAGRVGRRTAGALLDEPAEHRVARVLRDALAARERQVAEVEVARPPAEHRGVEGDDDRARSRPPRPGRRGSRRARRTSTSTAGTSAGASPIAAAHSSIGSDAWLENDHRHAQAAAARATATSAPAVRQLQHPDRCEQQRCRQPAAEQLDRGVAAATPRSIRGTSRSSVERRAVGPRRCAAARRTPPRKPMPPGSSAAAPRARAAVAAPARAPASRAPAR